MRLLTREPLVCREFAALVTEYFDGALPRSTRKRFEKHLALCEGCTAYLVEFRATVNTLGELPDEPADPHVHAHLLAAFREVRG